MSLCKWNKINCINAGGSTCDRCFLDGQFYQEKKIKQGLRTKAEPKSPDGRMGSKFEFYNHQKNKELINTAMTLNSGATSREKGDEQIKGIVNVMEELKTQMPDRAKGTKSFTIQRKWLDKLNSEAQKENKEFWYLKFAFDEDDVVHSGGKTFIILEENMIMALIESIIKDRKKAMQADASINLYKNKYIEEQQKAIYLQTTIDSMKASKEYIDAINMTDNIFKR